MIPTPCLSPPMLLLLSRSPSPPSLLRRLIRLISSSVSASHQPPSPPVSRLGGGGLFYCRSVQMPSATISHRWVRASKTLPRLHVITFHSVESVINSYSSSTFPSWLKYIYSSAVLVGNTWDTCLSLYYATFILLHHNISDDLLSAWF